MEMIILLQLVFSQSTSSENGRRNWTTATGPTNINPIYGLTFANEHFMLAYKDQFAYSHDGNSWDQKPLTASTVKDTPVAYRQVKDICGIYVIGSDSSSAGNAFCIRSDITNTANWKGINVKGFNKADIVAYGGGTFVAQ